ncbi:MAG: chromosomal replication initiator protein DnaA [Clostridia bacterium]|nr:chromosomal replication initiator protein DnaA [Clostridia bacterium]
MQELTTLWQAVLDNLRPHHTSGVVELWFGDARLAAFDKTKAVVILKNEFKRGIVMKKYYDALKNALCETVGFENELILLIEGEPIPDNEPEKLPLPQPESNILSEEPAPFVQNHEYTFDNFIVGSSNQFAHAACTAVARNPATDYNPLFIYSQSGLGKTHLLNAIMNEIAKRHPEYVIMYVKGDDFTNQMIDAISKKTQVQFRNTYRRADVLLIDDIQFIAGKESTQEEFFHTFNALYEDHKQIIMTSDRPPKDIKTLEDRLMTRFEWGLIADIQQPDYELRIAIMNNKTKMMGITLPDEVLAYIAENLKSNIRQLEGVVKKICARSFLTREPITLAIAKECVAAYTKDNDTQSVTPDMIVARVAKKYGISKEDIYGRQRTKHIATARNISIYIIRKITGISFPMIGELFDRDHSTIISANNTVENNMKTTPLFAMEINDLIKEITE